MAKGSPSFNINLDEEKDKKTSKKTVGTKPNRKDYPSTRAGGKLYVKALRSWKQQNPPKPKSWQKSSQKTFDKYTARLKQLRQIKNPNDFQKNQIKNAEKIIAESKDKGAERTTPLDPADFGDAAKLGGKMKKDDIDTRRQKNWEGTFGTEVAKISIGGGHTATLESKNNKNNKDKKVANNNKIKTLVPKPGGSKNNEDKSSKSNDSQKVEEKSTGSNVFTRHYKTGETLGVMTRSERRAYDKEAAGRTFGGEVSKHEKSSGHGQSNKRETLYKASQQKGSKSYKANQARLEAARKAREEEEKRNSTVHHGAA